MTILRGFRYVSVLAALFLTACATQPAQESVPKEAQAPEPGMAEYMSNENVQIFSLDDEVPLETPAAPQSPADVSAEDYKGYSYAGDSRVTVYALDDRPAPGSSTLELMPPSERYMFESPFMDQDSIPVADKDVKSPGDMQGESLKPGTDPYRIAAQAADASRSSSRPVMAKIYFAHDSSSLDRADKKILDKIAADMAREPNSVIVVEGHASHRAEAQDPIEKRLINLRMSLDRAYRVSREMMHRGVPATSLRTVGLGDTRLGVSPADMTAEEASRRVEIYTVPGTP